MRRAFVAVLATRIPVRVKNIRWIPEAKPHAKCEIKIEVEDPSQAHLLQVGQRFDSVPFTTWEISPENNTAGILGDDMKNKILEGDLRDWDCTLCTWALNNSSHQLLKDAAGRSIIDGIRKRRNNLQHTGPKGLRQLSSDDLKGKLSSLRESLSGLLNTEMLAEYDAEVKRICEMLVANPDEVFAQCTNKRINLFSFCFSIIL